MQIRLFWLILFFIGSDLEAQNLIPDPGFELLNGCPKLYEFERLTHWKQAKSQDTMAGNYTQYGLLYHKCSGNVPNTGWGYYDTHTGEGMASIVAMFIYTKVKEPLEKDKSYRCSFWLKVGTKNNVSCWWQTYDQKISLFTFNTPPLDTVIGPVRQPPAYTWNIVEKYDTSWVRFECCYKAKGGEKYIGFGYKDTFLSIACDDKIDPNNTYRPPFLSVTITNAFRQLPFFIDDVEFELSEDEPLGNIELKEFICRDSTLTLNGTNYHERKKQENVYGYQWNTGEKTPTIKVQNQGKYSLTINEACRKKQLNFTVKNKNCYCNVFIPNIFSPDGDGINDNIKPFWNCSDAIVSRYNFSIYNRWGNRLFQTQSLDEGWDGFFNDKAVSSDMYLWVLEYDIKIGNKVQTYVESGDINIIK
jgi:gliding motility-associated-like protein